MYAEAPEIPSSYRNADGRIDNSGDALITRMWTSHLPSCAWHITEQFIDGTEEFESLHRIQQQQIMRDLMQMRIDAMSQLVADFNFIYVAFCKQETYHFHAVVTSCNQYSWARMNDIAQQTFRDGKNTISPTYGLISRIIKYIEAQEIEHRQRGYVSYIDIRSYGNLWEREQTGLNNIGFSRYLLERWCSNGFPCYAAGLRRYHFFNKVHVRLYTFGDGIKHDSICHNQLKALFGNCAAAVPFLYDIRGILCCFKDSPPPGYKAQPGIVLTVSGDYDRADTTSARAQRLTIRWIYQRQGVFSNVELLYIIKVPTTNKNAQGAYRWQWHNK